ncbi:MAG TPA: hypothetical protein VGB71_03395, partial [Flavisolibacter sp.]
GRITKTFLGAALNGPQCLIRLKAPYSFFHKLMKVCSATQINNSYLVKISGGKWWHEFELYWHSFSCSHQHISSTDGSSVVQNVVKEKCNLVLKK